MLADAKAEASFNHESCSCSTKAAASQAEQFQNSFHVLYHVARLLLAAPAAAINTGENLTNKARPRRHQEPDLCFLFISCRRHKLMGIHIFNMASKNHPALVFGRRGLFLPSHRGLLTAAPFHAAIRVENKSEPGGGSSLAGYTTSIRMRFHRRLLFWMVRLPNPSYCCGCVNGPK